MASEHVFPGWLFGDDGHRFVTLWWINQHSLNDDCALRDDLVSRAHINRGVVNLSTSVHNLETALQAKKVAAEVLFINCPIVSIKH